MQKIDDPRSLVKVPTRIRAIIKQGAKDQKISMIQYVENAVWLYQCEGKKHVDS